MTLAEVALYDPPAEAPRVPRAAVTAALVDARSAVHRSVHPSVARAVARGSNATARLRLERLARVVMATDSRIDRPEQVWAADWAALPVAAVEAIDRGIASAWSAPSTRNAMRDSVRAVIRAARDAGKLSHDQALPRLNAVAPERATRDDERQARGHLSADRVHAAFARLAVDESATARRDAALIALLVGAGLRRAEATGLDMDSLDDNHETIVVTGKGGAVRDVPLAPGVRRAIRAWLAVRSDQPGPLLTPISKTVPRVAVIGPRLSTATVAQAVTKRFGAGVAPHDLRRTFTGDLLDSGADLSTASKVLGHVSPATTAGYDRRGHAARRAAVERLHVPFDG